MKKRFLQTISKRVRSLRLFSLLVCLGMLLPAVGWGQSLTVENITVNVDQDGYWTTNESGQLTASDAQNYNVFYDATNKVLTLKDATIVNDVASSSGSIIRIDHFDQFTILLIGNNALTSTNDNCRLIYGFSSNVVIKKGPTENASLTGNSISECIKFDSSANLTIENCIVNVTSSRWSGIQVYGGTLTLQNNARVTVESNKLALVGDKGISITDSKVTATANGAETNTINSNNGNIKIDNSTVKATGTSEDAYPAIYAFGDIMVENGSEVTATSSGMRGIFTDSDMTINGSTVTASGATNEGMVVIGTLTVTNSALRASSKPNDIIPAIVTEHLDITASELTAQGGIHLYGAVSDENISFSITPANGKLAEFKVDGTNWDGSAAKHFREAGQESPYDTKVNFSAESMNWLGAYRYIHIGEHVHTGGTANCENPAICDDCGRPYGDNNPNYHHDVERIDAKEATCTEPGNIEYWRCAACGKCYSDVALTKEISIEETVIPAGHKIVKVEAKAPTCTEDGNKEYWYCDRCGKYFSDEAGTTEINLEDVVIPATGHHYVNGYCTECGQCDPNYVDPISYYNIYVEEVCDGVEVTTSKNVVREGGSITVYVEKDTANYTFDNFKVYYKRSYYGGWEELKEGTQPGEYPIKNIWTHIYIKAEGAEKKKDPTGIESIEGVKVYTKDGSLYVQTPQREQVIIISMAGAVVKNEEQVGLKQYHGLQPGIYIVRVGDRTYKVRLY